MKYLKAAVEWVKEANEVVVDHLAAWLSWAGARRWAVVLVALSATTSAYFIATHPKPKGPQIIASGGMGGFAAPYTIPSQIKYNCNTIGCVSRPIADVLSDFVNVKSYGAVCDGVTDDSTAIQAAVTDAGTKKQAVWISPNCLGTYTNPNFITIFDLRVNPAAVSSNQGIAVAGGFKQGINGAFCGPTGVGDNCYLGVYHTITPIFPAPQAPAEFPMGNDLLEITHGLGDIVFQIIATTLTSTTTVAAPGSMTITVGTPASPTTATTATFCPPTTFHGTVNCTITIDPYGVNEETILAANWSIVDATHITATFAKSHTQPYLVSQEGSTVMDHRRMVIRPYSASGRQFLIQDLNLNTLISLPNDATATWPNGGISFNRYVTGAWPDGTNSLRFRLYGATSRYVFLNDTNTTELLAITDAGAATFSSSVAAGGAITGVSLSTTGAISAGTTLATTGAFTSNTGSAMFGVNTLSGLAVTALVSGDGGGLKHKRFGASCTTGAAAGNTCTTTFSWTTGFADANYTPVCWGEGPTGSPILTLSATQIAASVTVQVQAATAAASSFAGVYCMAMHD